MIVCHEGFFLNAETARWIAGIEMPAARQMADPRQDLRRIHIELKPERFDFPVNAPDLSYPEWRGVVTKTYTYAAYRDRPWVL